MEQHVYPPAMEFTLPILDQSMSDYVFNHVPFSPSEQLFAEIEYLTAGDQVRFFSLPLLFIAPHVLRPLHLEAQ